MATRCATWMVLVLAFASCLPASLPADTIGPWQTGDFAVMPTATDDRPNQRSQEIVSKHYVPLVEEKQFLGEKKNLGFRIAPRNKDWAGILITTPDGKPMKRADMVGYSVEVAEAETGRKVTGLALWGTAALPTFDLRDTVAMYSDASRIYPKTEIKVLKDKDLYDRVVIDFSSWKLPASSVQMKDLVPSIDGKGFVRPKGMDFIRDDGKQLFFWGGHENHIPNKGQADLYAETYREAGINVMRHIGMSEMFDPKTGKIIPEMLDRYHYLISVLGKNGIYFFMSDMGGSFTDLEERRQRKAFWKEMLTAVNPYTQKALKDDPTVIGFELSNEFGMNDRQFDYSRVDKPDEAAQWRKLYNAFLLKKYGSREALAKAWEAHPLLGHEDPAKDTICVPSNFRGARGGYGGTGGHDQVTRGKWYINGAKYGLPSEHNPRIVDAIEFNNKIAKKTYPFDFNNLTTPRETEELRLAFNDFVAKKYPQRLDLTTAWVDDQVFRWETPGPGIDRLTGKVDPALPTRTIQIPTNYRGQATYERDDSRLADPRVTDAIELTYQIQRDWATDLTKFLRDEVGLKCAIGWNGDTFHVCQVPNHKANMDSPGSVTLSACYCDLDTGIQLTSRIKNLKRFTYWGFIHDRPTFAYEWGGWSTMGPFQYEYILQASLMGRVYGFDGLAHHKMSAMIYPVRDPLYSLNVHYITPISDRPRRGAFYVGRWIIERSKVAERRDKIIIGYPDASAFCGGPERRLSSPGFENWVMYQLPTADYSFKEVYDGPKDRIVIHEGRAPVGDYRKAKHAVLWSHSNSGPDGKDAQAKKKWFALHGIEFKPGQKYYLDDKYFATTEDMTEYVVTHGKAEQARWAALGKFRDPGPGQILLDDDYWAAEPDAKLSEMDRQLYQAFKSWGYKLPLAEEDIDKVWRGDGMFMDTTRCIFEADRDDMQLRFGKGGKGTQVKLSRLEASSDERQYSVALLPWDTADFRTAKSLALWCMWDGEVTVKADFPSEPEIYAVNWLGVRIFKVKPVRAGKEAVTFMTARHDDIFCYEIERPK